MKILFVVNPAAGGKDHSATIEELRSKTAEQGMTAEFLLTDGHGDEKKLLRSLDRFSPDRVVAGGGDGTIRMVAKNLITHKLPLGIIPLGSANGLAKALEISTDPLVALDTILSPSRIKKMDMLRFNDKHLSIHLADIGVNALIVKKYEEAG